MRKLTIILYLLVFSNQTLLQAQKTAIQGTVMATDSVTPLQGVDIFLEQSNMFTTSNSNGVFTLVGVADGNYNLICSAVGYSTQRITVQVQNGLSSILNIYLKEQINQLNEVVVMSGGDRSDVILCGSVQYISPKEIEAFRYSDVNRVLRLAPGTN
ncbi:MAG TPA: carboxypeptidase-like regulatory domain-containing protein, partial [Chitinophagales bacterium]|nr:carboxypeptidase-like regulatory domain-containing protein [Chitinophagales bacterium]